MHRSLEIDVFLREKNCILQPWLRNPSCVGRGEVYGTVTLLCKKKVFGLPVPSREVTNQTLPGREYTLIQFLARESLVSDIPAGDGKTDILFYSVIC
jgi:hypothetical protein